MLQDPPRFAVRVGPQILVRIQSRHDPLPESGSETSQVVWVTGRIKSKTSSNFYSKGKTNNLFFENNPKSGSVFRGNRTKSFFQISRKHVKRDINKFDLNPSFQKENAKPRNLHFWSTNCDWAVKGIKIKQDIAKQLVRRVEKMYSDRLIPE